MDARRFSASTFAAALARRPPWQSPPAAPRSSSRPAPAFSSRLAIRPTVEGAGVCPPSCRLIGVCRAQRWMRRVSWQSGWAARIALGRGPGGRSTSAAGDRVPRCNQGATDLCREPQERRPGQLGLGRGGAAAGRHRNATRGLLFAYDPEWPTADNWPAAVIGAPPVPFTDGRCHLNPSLALVAGQPTIVYYSVDGMQLATVR
jgi:hypothetical protein